MEENPLNNLSNGQQQFNLRWNNHTNNILQVFIEHFTCEDLIDVTLACEGHFIKAHKMILSACSPYFRDLFKVHTVDHPLIIINGMKYNDVKQVIDFMYRGEIKILEAELDSLLAVAESLQVKGLCSVRNNYDKLNTGQSNDQQQTSNNDSNKNVGVDNKTSDVIRSPKKRKLSDVEESFRNPANMSDDESLAGTIKIEPPEIKDIDPDEDKLVEEQWNQQESIAQFNKPVKQIKTTTKSGRLVRQKTYLSDTYATTTTSHNKSTKTPGNNNSAGDSNARVNKIPRPPNAFMIFANEWRRKLAAENPKESNKEISVRLGVMWKNLSCDLKENYYSASRKADEEHKRKYPGYYYSPKEARLRKNKRDSVYMSQKQKSYEAIRFVKLVMSDNIDSNLLHYTTSATASEVPVPQHEENEDEEEDETVEEAPENINTDNAEIEVKFEADDIKLEESNQNTNVREHKEK